TRPVVITGLSGVTQLSMGSGLSCALRSDGTVACLGNNSFLQLGSAAASIVETTPVTVTGVENAKAVAAGENYFACALLAGGTVKCWGSNRYGEIGMGTIGGSAEPTEVMGITDAVAISTG